MSFTPVIPGGGFAGWSFLTRTLDKQKAAYLSDPAIRREEAYFRAEIGKIGTAEALVNDRRLLRVALTAFGLESDMGNKAFLRKVLEDGTLKPGALSSRLADKRYAEFARAFGFGDFPVPNTGLSTFPDTILQRFEARRFEGAVGQQNETMRLALNARRELPEIAAKATSETSRWFAALGSPPVREVIQVALGLPPAFTRINLDKQVEVLKERAQAQFGFSDLAALKDPAMAEKVVRRFLVRADLGTGGQGGGAAALTLLQGTGGSGGLLSRLV